MKRLMIFLIVASTVHYKIDLRVACNGDDRTITDDIATPDTKNWQAWHTITANNIPLTVGQHILRLTIGATSHVDINFLNFISWITDAHDFQNQDNLVIYSNSFASSVFQTSNKRGFGYQITDIGGLVLEKGNGEKDEHSV